MIVADVYKADVLVGYFSQHPGGVTEFDYKDDATGPVATSLPLISAPYVTFGGAIPPFFTNLLPEGRRLSNLKRTVKPSTWTVNSTFLKR